MSMFLSELLEACMVVCFGISWPLSIRKSWVSKTAKGKSLVFSVLVWIGYICGISSKIVSGRITYVFFFYVLNLFSVSIDILLYLRNMKLDKLREKQEEQLQAAQSNPQQ